MKKSKYTLAMLSIFLTACGGDDNSVSVVPTGETPTSETIEQEQTGKIAGTAAVGAGLKGYTADVFEYDITNKLLSQDPIESKTLDESSQFEFTVPLGEDKNSKVFLIRVNDLESPENIILETIVFGEDIEKLIKVTPYTDIIAKRILNDNSITDIESAKEKYDNLSSTMFSLLEIFSDALLRENEEKLTLEKLLFGNFPVESSGHDELLEIVTVDCDGNNSACSLDIKSDSVKQQIAGGTELTLNLDDSIITQITELKDAVDSLPDSFDLSASLKNAGPVILHFGIDGHWGTAEDEWAGYNGKIKVVSLSDKPIEIANQSLSFVSEKLDMNGAWGASAEKTQLENNKVKYTFTFPHYAQPLRPDDYRTIGFNGKGVAADIDDLTSCALVGKSCIIKYDDSLIEYMDKTSFTTVLDSNDVKEVVEDSTITDDVIVSNPDRKPLTEEDGDSSSSSPEIVGEIDIHLEKSGTPWSTGFNALINFTSPVSTESAWSLDFSLPEDIDTVSIWSYDGEISDNRLIISNYSWNGKIEKDEVVSIGGSATGNGRYGSVSDLTDCTLTLDAVEYTCKLMIHEDEKSAEDLLEITSKGAQTVTPLDLGVDFNTGDSDIVDNNYDDPTSPDIPADMPRALAQGNGLTETKTPKSMNTSSPSNFDGKIVAGYFSEWSVYGREFDVERLLKDGAFPYNKLVFAFLGICGDEGTKAHMINTACERENKSKFEAVILDGYASYEKAMNPRQASIPWGPDRGVMEQLKYIKQQVPDIKISMSIGGWTMSEVFHRMAANPAHIATFVNSLKELKQKHDFVSGFDIDWEFPGHGGESAKFTERDGEYFKDLVCAVKEGIDGIEVSSAVGATATYIGHVGNYYKEMYDRNCLDYLYMMNYDFFGAWDNTLGHQTSLMPSTSLTGPAPDSGNDERWSINTAVELFEANGFMRDRLIVGVANYGRGFKSTDLQSNPTDGAISGTKTSDNPTAGSWENGVVEGYDLWRNVAGGDLQGRGNFALYSDFEAHADAYYNSYTGDYISIDTPRTAYMKGKLADILGLAGTFVWTVEQDDGRIVMAMQDGLGLNDNIPDERVQAYTACGIPFADTNKCEQLYNGLNSISGDHSGSSISDVLEEALSLGAGSDPIQY